MNHLEPLISLKNVHVTYESFKALNGIDFDLNSGEIHGLVGEHRAGKSTLVKLLSGAVIKESGHFLYKGQEVESFSPRSAMQNGIGIIYQDLNIIPSINAVENIFTGQRIVSSLGFLKSKEMKRRAASLLESLNMEINMEIPLSSLTRQEQQMVEIAKALSLNPEILIFDEISSRLTPTEMEKIYKLLFEFKNKGKSIIYISHNMDEIFRFADRVTILQDGRRIGTEEVKDLDKIKLMKLTYSFVLSREELEKDNMELYLLKKYNENIIKNIPIGVMILDKDKQITQVNLSALKLFSPGEEELTGKILGTVLGNILKDHGAEISKAIELMTEGVWEDLQWSENRIVTIKVFPLHDNSLDCIGSILLLEDVSQERHFNDYLLRSEKIASVAELAAGVAHEINTPLSVIHNYIDLLKPNYMDSYSSDKLDRIKNQLSMISDIIGGLLSFTKIQSLPPKQLDITELVDDVVLLIQHKIISKNIHLKWEKGEQNIYVSGDENRLKQVLINLLINGIEAVLEGGHIGIFIEQNENEWVEISIRDDGSGIPPHILSKIFNPFFSTKAGKKNTGLGLSICQHIIESHNGVITCQSDEGTTMGIRLPIVGN
ncbi:ATP-binding protein [Oceanispirochaeta sp. M2]|nr:ATP-binding protein [Oceanispirochaeta sp. M2]MBF9016560.1 ATP-binding cassette domain-containing protein [Oceanispirochaeta sp. M2]